MTTSRLTTGAVQPAAKLDEALAASPFSQPLSDAQGRVMTYLRLSVTDRCNFRCTYCSPAHWGGKKDLLQPDEMERMVSVFARLGIRRVRLTGGEPLIRPDIVEIVRRIASVPGIGQVAMTTNASRLAELAVPLQQAGLKQLNVSLDTLSAETFRRISKMGEFGAAIAGIEAAAQAGFELVKLNTVVMRGVNEEEVGPLIRWAHARGLVPRFIELMPFGQGVPVETAELIAQLAANGMKLEPEESPAKIHAGPARYWRTDTGTVGFISPLSQNFCGGCNRVRVSSKGELRACLGGRVQAPLSQLIRGGASDDELARAIREALGQKPDGHRFTEADGSTKLLPMMGIGG